MQECRTLLIGESRPSLGGVDNCLRAVTLTGWSTNLHCMIVVAQTCKQWSCRFCGEMRSRKLAQVAATAKPNKLMTLTVNPARWDDPRHAFDETRRKCSTLIQMMRRTWGEFEYLRVLEMTRKGWPHYHFVARCGFIPQPWLSEKWNRLTGAPIVDIRKLHKTREAYWYVMKYLGKQDYCSFTDRRVTLSKNFATKPEKKNFAGLGLEDLHRECYHPRDYIRWQFPGREVTVIGPLVFALSPIFS